MENMVVLAGAAQDHPTASLVIGIIVVLAVVALLVALTR